ncbi:apoptosis-inducing factor 3 isoform X2 [Leptopilina boulardi]|uniref:apoptosis-inducing factor 3 isoform X2 n=1 Tax=Leptopilina boulardi TaxID=63433 RepID=UPI0021F61B6A|nr:apoptosis-inducing factor 3 isoform X2 [Leptopilina boulardi]XP_051162894.1 apoptosis-inducing factor 3 isoform X2 [Leptopilina boulardi]XP_051162895.1 apoptosis-inducing factor 3 isoform X2 [Leptopilina boulardi]XP_051162896.1 apoptosis-inducing factor 3 isoform X2 [Leptopilina boulardi]XP_051162897.1 apoptosis-inducing factor 3 isoform X2 [Leptopilina boulardi]
MGGSNCKSFSPRSVIRSKSSSSSGKSENNDYIEGVVCNEEDIKENEMKMLSLGEDGGKVLLIKQKGEFHAIGTKCTHYGALLHTGALGEGRVRCPWHGACFNIKTGDIEDYPGLDSLPCYQVSVNDNGNVRVRAKRKDLEANRRTKEICPFNLDNLNTAVIIGGGPAGATCAETLRQEGFTGRIIMICKENSLPYDRIKVSKIMDLNVDNILLRSQMFYDEYKIETRLGIEATGLDTERKLIKLNKGEEINYKHLFISTGCRPRVPDTPGIDLKNIFYLRNYTDSNNIHKQLSSEKHVIILGTSFIGMEAAAYCIGKCASVTVIGRESVPLEPVFGAEIGERVKREFESKGIKFIFKNSVEKYIGKENDDKILSKIEMQDGTILPADIAIIGIGSFFNTEWLKESSIKMLDNGTLEVDKYLKTNVENVYAGGDIAFAPLNIFNTSAAIGHFSLAHYHGKIAAFNICGKETPLNSVPFFWTTLFGKSYRYAGYGRAESFKVHGSLEDFKFFAYYFKNDQVIAMSSVGRDPIVADFANLLYEGKILTREEVEKNPTGWMRNIPKDMLPSLEPEKTTIPFPDTKSIGPNMRNQSRRYHTIAFAQRTFCNTRHISTTATNCLFYKYSKLFKYFRVSLPL